MKSAIQTFQNQEFGTLRTVLNNGEPWFVAKDICNVLEIENSRDAVARLDADEKNTVVLTDGTPGNPKKTIVSESGLYSLVLGSRKPQAHEFKRWVTHDVIPSIRKHGLYATPDTAEKILEDPDFLIKALTELKQERAQRQKAEAKIAEDKPKVLFADSVACSRQSILIRELAKLLKQNGVDFGEKRLFSWLRANGYLISCGDDYNLPTQYSMDRGIMIIRERTYTDDVYTRIMRTSMITGKGQMYFVKKFLKGSERNDTQRN